MNKKIKSIISWVTGRGGKTYAVVYARQATENNDTDLSKMFTLSLARLQSEQMSKAIKRGIRAKKERGATKSRKHKITNLN